MQTLLKIQGIEELETIKIRGVYFLCKQGEIVYIGSSHDIANRVKNHPVCRPDQVFFIKVKSGHNLIAIEADYIKSMLRDRQIL